MVVCSRAIQAVDASDSLVPLLCNHANGGGIGGADGADVSLSLNSSEMVNLFDNCVQMGVLDISYFFC